MAMKDGGAGRRGGRDVGVGFSSGPVGDAAVLARRSFACQTGASRARAASARRRAAWPQCSAAGQAEAMAILMRRTLTRTSAPILRNLRRMVPAWAASRPRVLGALHRVAEIADLEGDARQRRGGLRLRFLDLDLRELLLDAADLVLELALRELRLAQVGFVRLLGLLELRGVDAEIGLQLLQLARERAGQLQVAGAVVGEDAALELLRAPALTFTWLLSRSATPAIRASARLYCVILCGTPGAPLP